MEIYIWGYIWGWLIYSDSLVERITVRDVFASHVAGLFWPISLPSKILRKILK